MLGLIFAFDLQSVPRQSMTNHLHDIPSDTAFRVYLIANPIRGILGKIWKDDSLKTVQEWFCGPVKRAIGGTPSVHEEVAKLADLPMLKA
jgi:hypothetical protein